MVILLLTSRAEFNHFNTSILRTAPETKVHAQLCSYEVVSFFSIHASSDTVLQHVAHNVNMH